MNSMKKKVMKRKKRSSTSSSSAASSTTASSITTSDKSSKVSGYWVEWLQYYGKCGYNETQIRKWVSEMTDIEIY